MTYNPFERLEYIPIEPEKDKNQIDKENSGYIDPALKREIDEKIKQRIEDLNRDEEEGTFDDHPPTGRAD
jgi:hypothetical protein